MTRLVTTGAKPPQNNVERWDAIDGTFYPGREILSEGHIVFKDRRACPLLGEHGLIDAPMTESTAYLWVTWTFLLPGFRGQAFVCAEIDGWPEFEPSSQTFLAELAQNVIASCFSSWTLEIDDQPGLFSLLIIE